MNAKKNYLNRKQSRKENRKQKKFNRNLNNYRHHNKLNESGNENNNIVQVSKPKFGDKTKKENIQTFTKKSQKDIFSELKLKEEFDEENEEIDSNEASLHPDDDSEKDSIIDLKGKKRYKFIKSNQKLNVKDTDKDKDNYKKQKSNNEVMEDEFTEENNYDKLFDQKYYSQNIASQIDYSKIDEELDKEINYLEKKLNVKNKNNYEKLKKRVVKDNFDDDLFDLLDNITKDAKSGNLSKNFKKSNKDSSEIEDNDDEDEEVEAEEENDDDDNDEIEDEDDVDKYSDQSIDEEIEEEQSEINESENESDNNIKISKQNNEFKRIKDDSNTAKETKVSAKELETLKLAFQKELNGLFNKTSESNIQLLYKDLITKITNYVNILIKASKNKQDKKSFDKKFFCSQIKEIYSIVTKLIFKSILENLFMNIGITSCLCTYLGMMHYLFGDSFIRYFLKELFGEFNKLPLTQDHQIRVTKLRNFTFLIIFLFLFRNLTMKLAEDLINLLIENFDEFYSEILYVLLSHVGIQLRKENPDAVKKIINTVKTKFNSIKQDNKDNITSKFKFVVEMIEEIKNNKHLKFNVADKYAFQKNLVAQVKNEVMNKNIYCFSSKKEYEVYFKSNEQLELTLNEVYEFDIDVSFGLAQENSILNKKINKNNKLVDEDIDNSNKEEEDEDSFSINSDDIEEQYNIIQLNKDKKSIKIKKDEANVKSISTDIFNEKCKELRINTELKKSIFRVIVMADDFNDAYEKLIKLNLNKEQEREIIKILILVCVNESTYNTFYFKILKLLIKFDKGYKYTYQYTHWDYLRNIDSMTEKGLMHLSRLSSELLSSNLINLVIFLPLEFTNNTQLSLLEETIIQYLKAVSYDDLKLSISKLIKNDTHNDFYKGLLGFGNDRLKEKIQKELLEIEEVSMKDKLTENYNGLIKTLKKII